MTTTIPTVTDQTVTDQTVTDTTASAFPDTDSTASAPTAAAPVGDRILDGHYIALPDPVSDRMFSLFSALLAEVWTVRDRLRLAEIALLEHGIDVEAVFAGRREQAEEQSEMRADRDAFIARVFRSVVPPVVSSP